MRRRAPGGLALLAGPVLYGMISSGCAVGPDYRRPATVTAPAAYKEPPGAANVSWQPARPGDAAARGPWWELYADKELNALEEKIAVSNETLKAATAQYLVARTQVRVARADYFPTVGVSPVVSRTHESKNGPNVVPGVTRLDFTTLSLEGQASWEPDLWGLVRRTVEQARANAEASAADLAGVALSVHAELAGDYFEVRGLDTQRQLLENTLTSDKEYLELTQRRFKGGVATGVDVAQAETQYLSVKAQLIEVGVSRAQFEHAIASLIGVPASTFSLAPRPLAGTPPAIPAGVPSALLERRPDIAGAERRAAAANAQIGIATAAYYPNVTLSGAGGIQSTALGTLFEVPSILWSVGASAFETLFDGGRRHALTEQARAAYDVQVANYRQSVLGAFQEVEDNLSALSILSDEATAQTAAVDAARRSLALSVTRYKGGVTTYLEVLTAQTIQLANERAQADVATRRFAASVQLVRALGGGWSASQLPRS
jgi:NodT family efflux transporter outer membrane factor (OMF) lipoprotein